jgi:hypothetical protein
MRRFTSNITASKRRVRMWKMFYGTPELVKQRPAPMRRKMKR